MTKSFTAAAIMMLIEDSVNESIPLKLETRVSSLIDFVVPDDYVTVHATLEDALSHRTGMPRHDLSYGGPNFTLQDMVHNLRYLPLTAEIRQKWQYCNMMFSVLSLIIEKLSGKWLGTFFGTGSGLCWE
jgi:CubicO group peptidase (beta-lactamase class C family)